jgi:hypothetical protein
VVARGAVLPAFPEGEVDVEDRGALQLRLEVAPGRAEAVAGVDPDGVGVADVLRVIAPAARQVDAAQKRDAAAGILWEMDDQELLVVAAEPAHSLVGDQLPAGTVYQSAEHAVRVLVEPDQRRVRPPQQPPDRDASPCEVRQQRTQLAARPGQQPGGVDAPVGQVEPVAGPKVREQLVQARDVRLPVHVDADQVVVGPGAPVLPSRVDLGRRVATLVGGEQPGRGDVPGSHRLGGGAAGAMVWPPFRAPGHGHGAEVSSAAAPRARPRREPGAERPAPGRAPRRPS